MNRQKPLQTAALAAGILIALAAAPSFAADFRTSKQPVDGQYIVVLKPQAAKLSKETASKAPRVPVVANDIAAAHRANLVRSYEHALRGFVVKADDATLAKLLADPRVAYVEEDGVVSVKNTQGGATWGLDRVDQRNLPLNGTYTYSTTATGVRAYIIDTGVLGTHNEFVGRMGNGFDAIGDGWGTSDCNGHGTHVAGTVGGTTWGVAKGVTIHPVRVLGCSGSGTWSGVIAGMDWVAANRVLPAVANMSLGGGANSSVDAAVANLTNAGVTVVVAAGNVPGANACNSSPARAPSAITVGSTDSNDARSSFSSVGSCLDIFAPGGGITSAWHTSTTATNTISGTSMAAPHVAGAAALFLANNPSATPGQVTTAIINNATPNKVTNAGSGSPNRLLFTSFGGGPVVSPPSISGLWCNFNGVDSDCSVTYSSSTPASVGWSAGSPSGDFTYSVCGILAPYAQNAGTRVAPAWWGQPYSIQVTATVSNQGGSVSATAYAQCNPSGNIY